MSVNKKPSARRSNALRMTDARKSNLAACRRAAFNSGTSRNALVASIANACGKKPVLTLSDAVRFEVVIGLMAAALARKGDNRPEAVLTEHCRVRLTQYQGFGGKAKLRKDMLGRRTKVEEEAYLSARVQWSGLAKDAGVTLPTKSGSNSTGRKPRPASNKTAKVAANDTKPVIRKYRDKAALIAYLQVQGKAMLAVLNKNAGIAPNEAKSAVQDFNAALNKIG